MSDLIDREDAVDTIREAIIPFIPYFNIMTQGLPLACFLAIRQLPSVEKTGKWIIQDGIVCCSECGEPNMERNYCPNCGADMRNEEISE